MSARTQQLRPYVPLCVALLAMLFITVHPLSSDALTDTQSEASPIDNRMTACIDTIRATTYEPAASVSASNEDFLPLEELEEHAAEAGSESLIGRRVSVEGEDFGVRVPSEGLSLRVRGTGVEGYVPPRIDICNPGDGTLVVDYVPAAYFTDAGPELATTKCDQNEWASTVFYRIPGDVDWYYNNVGGQTHIGVDEFAELAKSGFDGMLTGRNACGLPDPISLNATRVGPTTASPGDEDGINTVGWASLPDGVLGVAYNTSDGDYTIEFDIAYTNDEVYHRLAPDITPNCGNSFHFGGVALHEVMHVYSFEHVEADQLVMFGSLARCSTLMYEMGTGDWLGVDTVYD